MFAQCFLVPVVLVKLLQKRGEMQCFLCYLLFKPSFRATNPPMPYNDPLLFPECEFVCSVPGRYFKTTRLPARVFSADTGSIPSSLYYPCVFLIILESSWIVLRSFSFVAFTLYCNNVTNDCQQQDQLNQLNKETSEEVERLEKVISREEVSPYLISRLLGGVYAWLCFSCFFIFQYATMSQRLPLRCYSSHMVAKPAWQVAYCLKGCFLFSRSHVIFGHLVVLLKLTC